MVFYENYNGRQYCWFNEVLKRFREVIDKHITKDELTSILRKLEFPIKGRIKTNKDGSQTLAGIYDIHVMESWLHSPSQVKRIKEALQQKRDYDMMDVESWIKQIQKTPVYDNRTQEEIEAAYAEERKAAMRKRIEAELSKLDKIEDEDMEIVSQKLIDQDN